jgi:hypothetical protein
MTEIGTTYTQSEYQKGAAIADAFIERGAVGGGGGGGGGATQAQIKVAIETATNLNELETLLADILAAGITAADIATGIDNASELTGVSVNIDDLSTTIGFREDAIASSPTATASLISLNKLLTDAVSRIQGVQGLSSDAFPATDGQITNLLAGLRRIAAKFPDLISGNLPVDVRAGTVEITNDIGNSIPVTGTLNVGNIPATNLGININQGSNTANVKSASALPTATDTALVVTIRDSVEISNDVGNPVPISGTISVGNTLLDVAIKQGSDASAVKAGGTLPNATSDNALVVTVRDPVFAPRKVSITGFLSVASANTNLLDASGSGVATDVRDYQSGELIIVSTATTGNYVVQSAFDAGFTIGLATLQIFEVTTQSANPINAAIIPTASTRKFALNLQGANYIRVNLNGSAAGVRPFLVMNQSPFSAFQTNIQQATAGNLQALVSQNVAANLQANVSQATAASLQATATLAANLLILDIGSGPITTSATTGAVTPTNGASYEVNIAVTAVTGTSPTLAIQIQESDDTGTNWYTVYTFPVITAVGSYRSPQIQLSGNRIRYIQTIGGTTPSFTRAINRVQSNASVVPFKQTIPTTINGTITTGGTAQIAITANSARAYLFIQNNSTADLWVNYSGTSAAVNAGIRILAGVIERYEQRLCPTGAVSIFGATTGQQYAIMEA